MMKSFSFARVALLLFVSAMFAHAGSSKPVMMMPPPYLDGICFRELFTHPDDWKETRSKITSLGYADWKLNYQFTDDELRAWLPMIHQWGLQFTLEVGGVKEWGPTGQTAFNKDRRYWDRLQSLGGQIDSIGMDEPLCCVRGLLKKSDAYAVEETANFVAFVRKNYPHIQVGDIEPYPFLPFADQIKWIDALQAKVKEKTGRPLDFYRLDVDWVHFVHGERPGWPDVKKIEEACRARHLPFSLVYWAADNDTFRQMNMGPDAVWYISTMQMGYDYALVHGSPDEYAVESWVDGPSHSVPETADWTFTRSVLDFCNTFVK